VVAHHLTIISCFSLPGKALTITLLVFPPHPLWCFTASLWVPLGEEVWPSSSSPLLHFLVFVLFSLCFFPLFPPPTVSSICSLLVTLHSCSPPLQICYATQPLPLRLCLSTDPFRFSAISLLQQSFHRSCCLYQLKALHRVLLPFVTVLCGSWKCPIHMVPIES
jgi:hypothetical protein